MTKLADLLAARQAIELQISELRSKERSDAIAKVQALMAAHGLSVEDVESSNRPRKKLGGVVAAKYLNQKSGETWSGRGLQPKWLKAALMAGATLDEFRIQRA